MDVYLSSRCFDGVETTFPYLVPDDGETREISAETVDTHKVKRTVADLRYRIVRPYEPFVAAGLKMMPLPVYHGGDMICNGYAFTIRGGKNRGDGDDHGDDEHLHVVYLFDISFMPNERLRYIQENLPPTDVLVVD